MLSLLQRDTNLNVRVRAATSLAVIFTNHSKNQESCVVSSPYSHLHTTQSRLHVLSSEQVHITADILLSALSDHDRVCSHVIRSLTVLVSYCMSQNSLEQSRGLIHRILVALGIQFNSAQAKVMYLLFFVFFLPSYKLVFFSFLPSFLCFSFLFGYIILYSLEVCLYLEFKCDIRIFFIFPFS